MPRTSEKVDGAASRTNVDRGSAICLFLGVTATEFRLLVDEALALHPLVPSIVPSIEGQASPETEGAAAHYWHRSSAKKEYNELKEWCRFAYA